MTDRPYLIVLSKSEIEALADYHDCRQEEADSAGADCFGNKARAKELREHLAQPEPVAWEGGEEWEPLAWALCADENGEEACRELIYEGGAAPEPWGERWLKYEDDARRMIAWVRKYTAPPVPAGWQLTLNYPQIIQLVAMYADDEDCEMTLHQGVGHSGDGIYASHAEYPEEGSVLLDPNEKVASDLSKAIPAGMVLVPVEGLLWVTWWPDDDKQQVLAAFALPRHAVAFQRALTAAAREKP